MQRHDSQERMEVGSPRAASHSASLDSSPSGNSLRSVKRRRIAPRETPSTSQGSIVTAVLGATDIFDGRSDTAYKNWLQLVQPTEATHMYASFVEKKVADQCDGVWTTGTVQCLHQGSLHSMTRTLPVNSILPNKSQPFSIVWDDNTDSICDLPSLLTYLDNHVTKRCRTDATRSPATGGRACRASKGAATPSSLPSSSPLPRYPLPPSNAPAPTAGIFAGIHSRPGDLVDNAHKVRFFRFPWRFVRHGVFLSSATFALLELCPKTTL